MSNKDRDEDIFDDAPLSMDGEGIEDNVTSTSLGDKEKKPFFSRRLLTLGAVLLFVVFSIFVLMSVGGDDKSDVATNAIAPGNKEEFEKIGTVATEAYQQQQNQYAEEKTERAIARNETFIPPPQPRSYEVKIEDPPVVTVPPQIEEKKEELPPPPKKDPENERRFIEEERMRVQKEEEQERKREQQLQQQLQQHNEQVRTLATYLSSLDREIDDPGRMSVKLHNNPRFDLLRQRKENEAKAHAQTIAMQAAEKAKLLPGVKVGDILYAINNVSITSDSPGPSMVTVISGPYKDSKVMGRFSRHMEHLVLEFYELITPGGLRYSISGFGIDPKTDMTAVRSNVDNHILERWGGLVAAAFLEGFGEAVEASGAISQSTAYGTTWTRPKLNTEQQLWMAAGRVGERASDIVSNNFYRPPTVTLDSGTEMGVLIMAINPDKAENAALLVKEQIAKDTQQVTRPEPQNTNPPAVPPRYYDSRRRFYNGYPY